MRRKILPLLSCVLAGACLPLAFAPFGLFFIAIISPAILVAHCLACSPAQAFARGYCFGLGMFATGVYWLHISINMFGGVTLSLAILATGLLVCFLALYPALVCYIARRWFSANEMLCLLLVFPALWTLAEWLRSWILTGFPWLNLGYSQVDSPLAGVAPVLGVYGLSWMTFLCATLVLCLFRFSDQRRWISLIILVLVPLTCWSLQKVQWSKVIGGEIKVALVQAAIPQELKWRAEMRTPSLEQYMALSAPHWEDDIVIWPETAIPAYPSSVKEFINKLNALTGKHGSVFFSGIPSNNSDNGDYFNSVMMLSGAEPGWYHKQHLVPFGEYLPLKPLLGGIFDFLRIPMSNFSPGTESRPILASGKLVAGISICYEDTFGEEVLKAMPEANVLVNVSNDAWFGNSLAPHQHMQMARMRALENARFMLRATNTGISAIINERGKVIARSEQFTPAVLSSRIRLFQGATPYSSWGNYPVVCAALLLLAIALLGAGTRKADE